MNPRHWSNRARISVAVLVIAIIAAAAASGGKKGLSSARRASDDAAAQKALSRALRDVAADKQDFHGYELVTAVTLKNVDRALRAVRSLKAIGSHNTFAVSVRSDSGTTFAVDGKGIALTDKCHPSGADCPAGRWSGPATLALPRIPKLTAAEVRSVRSILLASVDHYAALLAQGQSALGSTQYVSAQAGLAAFADPNSAASKFSDFQKHAKATQDLSYLNAFQKADSYFTAANEPAAISHWRDDTGTAQGDLAQWVQDAVSWQIKETTTAKLDADAAQFEKDLGRARTDITQIMKQASTAGSAAGKSAVVPRLAHRPARSPCAGITRNAHVSCPFALNVIRAYKAHPSANVRAYSPVTHLSYTMHCKQASGVAACIGGAHNDAQLAFDGPPIPGHKLPSPPPVQSSPAIEGPGSYSHAADTQFCSTHNCIANFPNGSGAIVQCADGTWSHSGGLNGACSDHGGES